MSQANAPFNLFGYLGMADFLWLDNFLWIDYAGKLLLLDYFFMDG